MTESLGTSPFGLAALLAFVGGLLSFLSPCVFPLVPGFLGYLVGRSQETGQLNQSTRLLGHAALFVLGFGATFTTAGLAAGLLLGALLAWLDWLRIAGGVAVVAMGLFTAGLVTVPWLGKDTRPQLGDRWRGSALGALALGVFFAAGWSPCIGTVLTAIFALAAAQPTSAGLLFFIYSLGLGLPFLAAAFAYGHYQHRLRLSARARRTLQLVSGGFMVVVGILLITNTFAVLALVLPPVEPPGL